MVPLSKLAAPNIDIALHWLCLLVLATMLSKTPKLLISVEIDCFIFIHPAPPLTPAKPRTSITPCGSIVMPFSIVNSLLLVLFEDSIIKPDCFVIACFLV